MQPAARRTRLPDIRGQLTKANPRLYQIPFTMPLVSYTTPSRLDSMQD